MELTTRRRNMLTGAISALVLFAAITIGVKGAFGAFDGGYRIVGRFTAAGQGLISGSDVKIHGVDVGEVDSVRLEDLHARVTLRIDDGVSIPTDAVATIRPKTLFGEKFVDIEPGPRSGEGPFLTDGDELAETVGGFELEEVLADTYPILQAVDGAELATVLDELADAGRGLGETINRSIVNGAELNRVFADNVENTRQFLSDLADVSEQLGADATEILELADAANDALPTLNEGEDRLVALLEQAGRLSGDVADLLVANPGFVDALFQEGTRTLEVLHAQRDQVVPLVVGLRQYLQTLSSIIRIDTGDGSLMAAVKAVFGSDLCNLLPGLCTGGATAAAGDGASTAAPGDAPRSGARATGDPGPSSPGAGDAPEPRPGAALQRGLDAVTGLLQGVLAP